VQSRSQSRARWQELSQLSGLQLFLFAGSFRLTARRFKQRGNGLPLLLTDRRSNSTPHILRAYRLTANFVALGPCNLKNETLNFLQVPIFYDQVN
jgi:hypothetical protein